MNKLQQIQSELKAPKNQINTYGGYRYRSCEDILEAVKPHLAKHELVLIITDDVREVAGRVYVVAHAELRDSDDKIIGHSQGWAREAESRKGMDSSQITGAASSYARKYALNGLFLIDDTKDADATNKHGKDESEAKQIDYVAAIQSAKTKADLKALWESMGQEQRRQFNDEVKARAEALQ